MKNTIPPPPRHQVAQMFDRIAGRYDLLNRLLSGRRDVAWRRALVRQLPKSEGLRILDLATGTADVLLAALRYGTPPALGLGLDPSGGMLKFGRKKLAALGLESRLPLLQGDAMHLPLRGESFDAITIAFGIRNVHDVDAAFAEMLRVLVPGGRAVLLEFSLPENWIFRRLYLFYFRHILPLLGGLVSGDNHAYRYLNQTVETFPYGEEFRGWMERAGFVHVKVQPLTFGIAALYTGEKPPAN